MVRVKVCGITRYEDAEMAVQLGVDALGFIFAASPRQIRPKRAREIIRALPPFVKTVGVFVDERPHVIREITKLCALDLIQFHGDEPPEVCGDFMPRAIKAFRVRDRSVLGSIRKYKGRIRAVLFDGYEEGRNGGTGKIFNWDIAVMGKGLNVPIILSGGLTPANIECAISRVRPFAVDVNSGIEERPGKKDALLIKAFMKKLRDHE